MLGGKKTVTRHVHKIGFNYQSVAFVKSHLHPFLQALAGLWFLVMCFADRAHFPLLHSPASSERQVDKLPYWFLHPSASPTKSIYQRPQFSGLGPFIFSNNEPERIISCCTCKSMDLLTLKATISAYALFMMCSLFTSVSCKTCSMQEHLTGWLYLTLKTNIKNC